MLWLRGVVFSVLIPGLVAFFVPQMLVRGRASAGGWYGAGWILLAAGVAIYIWCLTDFLRAGGTPAIFFTRPIRAVLGEEPRRVVRNGLYRYSRNPMYIGVLIAIGGQALLWRSRDLTLYLMVTAVCLHLVVVVLEEPHLARARGAEYEEYRREVPRWFGMRQR